MSFDDPAGLADHPLHNLNRTSQEVRELKAVKAEVVEDAAQANAARQLIGSKQMHSLVRAGTL